MIINNRHFHSEYQQPLWATHKHHLTHTLCYCLMICIVEENDDDEIVQGGL